MLNIELGRWTFKCCRFKWLFHNAAIADPLIAWFLRGSNEFSGTFFYVFFVSKHFRFDRIQRRMHLMHGYAWICRSYLLFIMCSVYLKQVWKYLNDTIQFGHYLDAIHRSYNLKCWSCFHFLSIAFWFHCIVIETPAFHEMWFRGKIFTVFFNNFIESSHLTIFRMKTMDFCWEISNPSPKFWQINYKYWETLNLIHLKRFYLDSVLEHV